MPQYTPSAQAFLAARDLLLRHRSDYAKAYEQFSWPALEEFNWALDYFDVMARGNNAPALWIVDEPQGEGRQYSYEQMSTRSAAVANFLRQHGLKRGDRLQLMLPNRVEMWDVMLAAMKLGVIVLPATTQLTVADVRERIEASGARFAVVDAGETQKFDGLQAQVKGFAVGASGALPAGWIDFALAYEPSGPFTPDGATRATDPLLWYFTSGTTSRPKLVEHTHQSYPVGHLSTMYWIGLQQGDLHWNISSPGWAKHAWSSLYAPWNAGACIFVYNYARFSAKDVLTAVVHYGVTSLCSPPTVWRMLVQEPLASYAVKLREVVGAGEPLNPEIIERVRAAWGLTIRDGYGQTETTCAIGNSPGQPVVPGSMGRPLPGYRVALIDPDDQSGVAEGEIALDLKRRPMALMTGYANNEKASAHAMRNGFYHTSDVASVDALGYYTYVGRTDDVFKSSDYRLSPFELESVLIEHPAIAEAAVVPSPDPLRLAVPKAFVTLRQGYEISAELACDVFAFVRERLAPYKRIRRLQFSDLPKTISGKIRRVELRRSEIDRPAGVERQQDEYWEEDFPQLNKSQ